MHATALKRRRSGAASPAAALPARDAAPPPAAVGQGRARCASAHRHPAAAHGHGQQPGAGAQGAQHARGGPGGRVCIGSRRGLHGAGKRGLSWRLHCIARRGGPAPAGRPAWRRTTGSVPGRFHHRPTRVPTDHDAGIELVVAQASAGARPRGAVGWPGRPSMGRPKLGPGGPPPSPETAAFQGTARGIAAATRTPESTPAWHNDLCLERCSDPRHETTP